MRTCALAVTEDEAGRLPAVPGEAPAAPTYALAVTEDEAGKGLCIPLPVVPANRDVARPYLRAGLMVTCSVRLAMP